MGIGNVTFITLYMIYSTVISHAFMFIPLLAIYTKITPKSIEGTIFAVLTGIFNLSISVVSVLMGNFLNSEFAHVTKKDQSGMKNLAICNLVLSVLCLVTPRLIPLISQIEMWQRERKLEEEAIEDIDKDLILDQHVLVSTGSGNKEDDSSDEETKLLKQI